MTVAFQINTITGNWQSCLLFQHLLPQRDF